MVALWLFSFPGCGCSPSLVAAFPQIQRPQKAKKRRRRSHRCTEGWKGEHVVVARVRVYKHIYIYIYIRNNVSMYIIIHNIFFLLLMVAKIFQISCFHFFSKKARQNWIVSTQKSQAKGKLSRSRSLGMSPWNSPKWPQKFIFQLVSGSLPPQKNRFRKGKGCIFSDSCFWSQTA